MPQNKREQNWENPNEGYINTLFSEKRMKNTPLISIVFATKNRLADLKRTLASIDKELLHNFDYEVVIVDGNSTDGTIEYLKTKKRVRLIVEDDPRGCCFAFDMAFRAARGSWVCWLNDDIEIVPDSFSKMMEFLSATANKHVGMGAFTSSRNRENLHYYVLNSCMRIPIPYANFGILSKRLLEQIGYLDLKFQKYGWDPDLAMKVWDAGYTVEACPGAHIIHYFTEDELRLKDEPNRAPDCAYLVEKWKDKVEDIGFSIDLKRYDQILDELDSRLQMRFLMQQGRLDEAEQKVLDAWENDQKAYLYFYLAGVELENKGYHKNASIIYQRTVAQNHEKDHELTAWAHFKLGEYHFRLNKHKEAQDHWKLALQYNPDHAKAKILLLSQDEPLNIIISREKQTLVGYIWVPMEPAEEKLWIYYFGERKINKLIIKQHEKTKSQEIEAITSNIGKYIMPYGNVHIYDKSNEDENQSKDDAIRFYFPRGVSIQHSSI